MQVVCLFHFFFSQASPHCTPSTNNATSTGHYAFIYCMKCYLHLQPVRNNKISSFGHQRIATFFTINLCKLILIVLLKTTSKNDSGWAFQAEENKQEKYVRVTYRDVEKKSRKESRECD